MNWSASINLNGLRSGLDMFEMKERLRLRVLIDPLRLKVRGKSVIEVFSEDIEVLMLNRFLPGLYADWTRSRRLAIWNKRELLNVNY